MGKGSNKKNKNGIPVIGPKDKKPDSKKELAYKAVRGEDVRPGHWAVTMDGKVVQVSRVGDEDIVEIVFETKGLAERYAGADFM